METTQTSTITRAPVDIYWELFHKHGCKITTNNARFVIKHATIEQLTKNPKWFWLWSRIVNHSHITTEMIFKHDKLSWVYETFYNQQSFTVGDFDAHLEYFQNNLKLIAANRNCDINGILCKYHNLDWDFEALSLNRNIKAETIQKLGNKGWNWQHVMVPELTCDMLKLIPTDLIKTAVYNHMKVISHEIFQEHCPKDSSLTMISYNLNIPIWEIIEMDRSNDPMQLSRRPDVNIDVLKKFPNYRWCWKTLSSQNPNIGIEDIMQNLQLPWSFNAVSGRSDLTVSIVQNNPKLSWNWEELSRSSIAVELMRLFGPHMFWKVAIHNIHVPMSIIINHHIMSGFVGELRRDDITIRDILINPKLDWNWRLLTATLPIQDIVKNKHLGWMYENLHHNPSIAEAIIVEYPHLFHGSLILSKNISLQFISEKPYWKWDWTLLTMREHL